MSKTLTPLLVAAMLAVPGYALAQDRAAGGTAAGAATGAVGGAIVGGPVGAAVGAVVGGVVGGTAGGLAEPDRVYVRQYVTRTPRPAVRLDGDVVVGATLPSTVRYYEIEGNPRLQGYRYAHVNDDYVVVDAQGRVVAIVE